jgi:MYXO-CTERM domain-containing protein
MTFGFNRWAAIAALFLANHANAALTVQFSNHDLADQVASQDLWSRSYIVKGDLAQTLELGLLFDHQTFRSLVVQKLSSPSLAVSIVQPDAASMGDGSLALEALRDLASDHEFTFDVKFVRSGKLLDTQPFVVFDRANETDLYRGTATLLLDILPGSVAEPSTAFTALGALGALGSMRRRREVHGEG